VGGPHRIKDRGARGRLRLREERISGWSFRKTVELEIEKQYSGFLLGYGK
jgi:hypothetical protein